MPDYYTARGNILGNGGVDYCILPIGDSTYASADWTTFTTVGSGGLHNLTFTLSEALTAWDNVVAYPRSGVPEVRFNDSDEEADTPDADIWSRDDSSGEAWSFLCWVYLYANNNEIVLNKFVTTGNNREWSAHVNSNNQWRFFFTDQSASVSVRRDSDTTEPLNEWVSLGITYDGGGGATAANGVTLYRNGAVLASTATNNASYVAMENLTGVVSLGFRDDLGVSSNFALRGGPLGPSVSHQQLTAAQMLSLYQTDLAALRSGAGIPIYRR